MRKDSQVSLLSLNCENYLINFHGDHRLRMIDYKLVINLGQKQLFRGVLRKRCSENM